MARLVATPPAPPPPDRSAHGADAPPVPGRGRPFVDVALRRLRDSLLLRICAGVAFLGYGGLVALLLAGRLDFHMAGLVAVLSLASWFILFWWFPVLERTFGRTHVSPQGRTLGTLLEVFAISCVVCVHLLMAIIILYAARG